MRFKDGLRQLARSSARPPVVAALLIGVSAAALTATAPDAASAGSAGAVVAAVAEPQPPAKTVSYLGRDFPVPHSWKVIDLTAHPATCVRFDIHAVYLGRPGADEDCPARGVGRRIGALLIEPQLARANSAVAVAFDRRIAGEIDVIAPGLTITASYGDDDRSTVVKAITAAGLPQPAAVPDTVAPLHDSEPVEIVQGTSQVTGLGFDTCTAPSAGQMQAWASSQYNTVGIYIGGSERACAQANLTPAWITARAKSGWHFMPLYVGWQAAWDSLTATAPATLGRQSADDAAARANGLGIGPGALLYYDMESYTASVQTAAALAFESAWTSELHADGYRSAVYSSASTGIADLVAHRGRMVEPDVVDIAQWNGVADPDLGATPSDAWQAARTHQYLGGVDDSYGGVKMNIDKDYLSINLAQVSRSPSPTPSPTESLSESPSPFPTASHSLPPSPSPPPSIPLPSPSAPFTSAAPAKS